MKYQGDNASRMFGGKGLSSVSKIFYGESAGIIANLIKDNLEVGSYKLLDMGGHKGEFLGELLEELPVYEFDSTIIDVVEGIEPNLKAKKVIGNIKHTEFPDKSFDLIIVRYVLAWNNLEDQKTILEEISRLCRGICIIQHQGADSNDPVPLQAVSARIFAGEYSPKLKRAEGFFTESKRIEQWLGEFEIKYSKVMERRIEKLSETFIEKFDLNKEESESIKKVLEGCDYINQSTFLLDFRG